jgi:hypothetical protein
MELDFHMEFPYVQRVAMGRRVDHFESRITSHKDK